jgi:hypothetical protein
LLNVNIAGSRYFCESLFWASQQQKNIKLSKGVNKAKQLSRVISKRTFRNVSKNIAAIPAEAVPYIGVGTMLVNLAFFEPRNFS